MGWPDGRCPPALQSFPSVDGPVLTCTAMQSALMTNLALFPRRNLAGLIAIYENNYSRLLRLIPELNQMQGTSVSRVALRMR